MIQIKKGDVFGELTYLKEAPKKTQPSGQRPKRVFCKCSCGSIKDYLLAHIIRNRINCCGCNKAAPGNLKTPLHNSWRGMVNRVRDKYGNRKHIYFDRGITMIEEWKNFNTFKKWAINNGYKEGLTIDRIDNDKGYSPDNCRWVSSRDNCNNRRDTYFVFYHGERIAFMKLVRDKGIIRQFHTIKMRIKRGWSVEEAVDTPIREGKYYNTGYKYAWA